MAKKPTSASKQVVESPTAEPTCGIVMPISDIEGYDKGHWGRVQTVLKSAAKQAGFDSKLVSDSAEAGVIQARIVANLLTMDVAVIDVSGLNANCFFELGLRVAFERPFVVVTDGLTRFQFDVGVYEHVVYDARLRFDLMETFRDELANKIAATYKGYTDTVAKNERYSPFLKHFLPPKLVQEQNLQTPVQPEENNQIGYLIEVVERLSGEVARLGRAERDDARVPMGMRTVAGATIMHDRGVNEDLRREATRLVLENPSNITKPHVIVAQLGKDPRFVRVPKIVRFNVVSQLVTLFTPDTESENPNGEGP